jgi:hydrogenase nickel incorporation protein HypA/HybF
VHELSLAGGILRMVEQARERDPFKRVTHLRLELGALSGVEADALRFALEAIAPDTCIAGANIDIAEPVAHGRCMDCGADIEVRSRLDACSSCGGFQWQAISGTELRVIELLVS